MTMTETPPAPATAKTKRRRRAAARRTPTPTTAAAKAEFPGLTATDCCDACNAERGCIITGSVCGHPFKGGLQPVFMSKPETLARFNRAKKALGRAKVVLPGA